MGQWRKTMNDACIYTLARRLRFMRKHHESFQEYREANSYAMALRLLIEEFFLEAEYHDVYFGPPDEALWNEVEIIVTE